LTPDVPNFLMSLSRPPSGVPKIKLLSLPTQQPMKFSLALHCCAQYCASPQPRLPGRASRSRPPLTVGKTAVYGPRLPPRIHDPQPLARLRLHGGAAADNTRPRALREVLAGGRGQIPRLGGDARVGGVLAIFVFSCRDVNDEMGTQPSSICSCLLPLHFLAPCHPAPTMNLIATQRGNRSGSLRTHPHPLFTCLQAPPSRYANFAALRPYHLADYRQCRGSGTGFKRRSFLLKGMLNLAFM